MVQLGEFRKLRSSMRISSQSLNETRRGRGAEREPSRKRLHQCSPLPSTTPPPRRAIFLRPEPEMRGGVSRPGDPFPPRLEDGIVGRFLAREEGGPRLDDKLDAGAQEYGPGEVAAGLEDHEARPRRPQPRRWRPGWPPCPCGGRRRGRRKRRRRGPRRDMRYS